MTMDWPTEIVKAVIVRQHLEHVDRLYSYPLPEVAASEADISATEDKIGPLDQQYRTFLQFANGWRCFLQEIDLFGLHHLLGAPPMDSAIELIAAVGHDTFDSHLGFQFEDLLTIGASDAQTDMWFLAKPGTPRAGEVLWFWGSDFETYPCFDEFYLAMVDYNRRALQQCQDGGSAI